MAARALENVDDRSQIESAGALRLLVGAAQAGRVEYRRQIEQRAGDGRHRDAVDDGAIGWMDPAGAVSADAGPRLRVPTRHRHVDGRLTKRREVGQDGRVVVTQQRVVAQRERGALPAAPQRRVASSDDEHPAKQRMQPPVGKPIAYRAVAEADLAQLA